MLRKLLSLLLAVGVLVTHLAAAPHAHAAPAGGKSGHDPRPHFHLSQLGLVPPAPDGPTSEHDADAWYLCDADDRADDPAGPPACAAAALAPPFGPFAVPAPRAALSAPPWPADLRPARHFVLLI